jgi:hypothetical protein
MTNKEILDEIAEYEELLKDASLPKDEQEMAKEEIAELKSKLKEEKPAKAATEKTSKAATEKPAKTTDKKDPYNCDDLIKEAKERHEKAKKAAKERADAPKKSEVTKGKEKIEKVHDAIEKQIEAGKFTKEQLKKLIAETKDLLNLLEKALNNL